MLALLPPLGFWLAYICFSLAWERPYWKSSIRCERYPLTQADWKHICWILTGNAALTFLIWGLMVPVTFDLPSPGQAAIRWISSAIWASVWFFASHYWCHGSPLYEHVHCLHHQYSPPRAAMGMFIHPVELLLVNIPASFGPVWWFSFSIGEQVLWLIALAFQLTISHSGIVVGRGMDATRHDLHHIRHRVNYSNSKYLDYLSGTECRH